MIQQPTQKQREYLASLIANGHRSHATSVELDEAAQEAFGYETWDEAPLSKRLASCLIDIFSGKAGVGLYVWAVRCDMEAAA